MKRAISSHARFVLFSNVLLLVLITLVAVLFTPNSITGTVQAETGSNNAILTIPTSYVEPVEIKVENKIEIAKPAADKAKTTQTVTDPAESKTELQAENIDGTLEQPEDNRPWHIVKMRVTAYCPCEKCCGKFSDGITACGHKIVQGDTFVAADKRYGFGTEMIIEGYNNGQVVEVKDRGGAIKGNKLDVFFNTHQEALEWGVRYIDVKVRYK